MPFRHNANRAVVFPARNDKHANRLEAETLPLSTSTDLATSAGPSGFAVNSRPAACRRYIGHTGSAVKRRKETRMGKARVASGLLAGCLLLGGGAATALAQPPTVAQ